MGEEKEKEEKEKEAERNRKSKWRERERERERERKSGPRERERDLPKSTLNQYPSESPGPNRSPPLIINSSATTLNSADFGLRKRTLSRGRCCFMLEGKNRKERKRKRERERERNGKRVNLV